MGRKKRRLTKQEKRVTCETRYRSRLNPPVYGWSGDLPDQAENNRYPPQLIWVNELNDIWVEIPRYVNFGWGGIWPLLPLTLIVPLSFIIFIFQPDMISYPPGLIVLSIGIFFSSSLAIYYFKYVLLEPRGAPVRFNRKRQKVYVYEFQKSFLPWKRWHPVIKVFDWKDIHGEWVMQRAHADWGHRIYCAVCKPDTFDVVDRFILTWTVGGIDEAGGLWSFCCHYMEKKPVPTAPRYTDKPRDWTPFRTVKWPTDVACESTTAPEDIRS